MGSWLLFLVSTGCVLLSAAGLPTWPSSVDELEDIMFLNTGHDARAFPAEVTPCSFSESGPSRITSAEWLRTAFHDMAPGSVFTGVGGLDASLQYELGGNGGENIGSAFNTSLTTYSGFFSSRSSMADLIAMGVYASVRSCGGPIIAIRTGRIDATAAGPIGVPQAQNSQYTFIQQFERMGFTVSEMIGLTACGHTIGGVHAGNFPEVLKPGTVANDYQHFDSTTEFDEKIASEFVANKTTDPLAGPLAVQNTYDSDLNVFTADNTTIAILADPTTFQSTCQTLLQRMIEVVPAGVVLTDPIAPYEVKPSNLQLTIQPGASQLQFSGEIRVRTTQNGTPSGVQLVYVDRDGASSCGSCVITTASVGTGAGFDESFAFYSFSAILPADKSISAFTVQVTTSAGTTTYDNNGKSYPVQDSVMYQTPQSCISGSTDSNGNYKMTVTAAVRNTASAGAANLTVETKSPRSCCVVPGLSTNTVAMTKQATAGAYTLYTGSYSLTPDQVTSSKFSVAAGSVSDSFKSTALTGSCSALSGAIPVAYTYVGCYSDSVNSRTLTQGVNIADDMTIDECSTFCGGFQYFGLEYSTECYCGNSPAAGSTTSPDTSCTMPCGGDNTETCGGPNLLSVYTNNKYNLPGGSTIPGYQYLGCYNDSVNARSLSDNYLNSGTMTPEACATFCSGSTYFGVEYYQQCFCGQILAATSTQQDVSDCSYACAGNSSEYCGGSNRMNLYQLGSTIQSTTAVASTTSISTSVASSTSTTAVSSTSTTAVSSTTSISTSVASSTSTTIVVASSSSSSTTTAILSTGTPFVGWVSLGCYNDSVAARVLSAAPAVVGAAPNMTVENCEAACIANGFNIAGVEYSAECYCDNQFRNGGAPASDGSAECTMPCNGNAAEMCGGPNRLNVYQYTSIGGGETTTTGVATATSTTAPTPTATSTTAVPTTTGPPVIGWVTLGCYNDSVANRVLSNGGNVAGGVANVSVESCEAACLAEGFTLAGVEYSGECYCDNKLNNGGATATDGNAQCTMTCNGNPNEMCGGPNRLNLYQYIPASTTANPTTTTTAVSSTAVSSTATATGTASGIPNGWSYSGCYVDGLNGRDLLNQQADNQQMSIESCVNLCASQGYTVAGMEYTYQCFCDNYIRNGAALASSDSQCAMPCSGNAKEVCGGPDLLSIYSIGPPEVLPIPTIQKTNLPGSWTYQGCLQDNINNERTFPYQLIYETNNTAAACLNRCAQYGFQAGGLEYGQQCFCGDSFNIPADAAIVDDSQCNMLCSGDNVHYCGGPNLLAYYTWEGESPLYDWSYASGNAAGEYQFLIGGVVVPLMTTVNINGKVTFLEKFGTGPPNTTGAYEFDPAYENNFDMAWRAMHVKSDIFCSAGLVLPDKAGRQLTVGGWSGVSTEGVRLYWPDGSPGTTSVNDWQENQSELSLQNGRWYPSGMVMANGSVLIVGGESGSNGPPVPTLEILPKVGPTVYMDWLQRTDPNNLYPFIAVMPGKTILAAYYNEARLLDQNTFATIRTLPNIPGAVNNDAGGRTYPLEGTMMFFPQHAPYTDPVTVLICGGSTPFGGDAIDNCASIQPEVAGQNWTLERMPSKRVMTCMAPLPDGTFLILNGAHQGVAGFGLATDPNFNAVLYDPTKPLGARMTVMANTTIARLYHSEAILMPDGRVLVSGSDPEDNVNPQEYRVEVFIPPYLLSNLPRPAYTIQNKDWAYGGSYDIQVTAGNVANLRVSLIGLISSTHGNSFGHRTFFPSFSCQGNTCTITAPPDPYTSPPGWFQLFILDGPTPSISTFVRIGGDPGNLGNWPNLPDFTVPGV